MRFFPGGMLRLLRVYTTGMAQVQTRVRSLPTDQQELRRPMNGYNFTERVRRVLAAARTESVALGHDYVGTEHILLGIQSEGGGVASTILVNLGVDGDRVRDRILETVKRGRPGQTGPDLPYTSRAKKILELAMEEARELNHTYVGTEHLLLGVVREEKGMAAQILREFGVTVEKAREEALRILGTAATHSKTRAWARSPMGANVSTGLPYPERLRRVLSATHDVAVRQRSIEVTPIHATIALLEHGEGLANAALDILQFDRARALDALAAFANSNGAAIEPDDALRPSDEFIAVLHGMEARPTRTSGIGTQDLLLSILRTSPEVVEIFGQQSVGLDTVRETLGRLSG